MVKEATLSQPQLLGCSAALQGITPLNLLAEFRIKFKVLDLTYKPLSKY